MCKRRNWRCAAGPARWRRGTAFVDPPIAIRMKSLEPAESRRLDPLRVRCCAVASKRADDRPSVSKPSFGKENSLPHARQDRQASSVSRPLEGRQRPKKPGPSLLQVASPVGRGAPVCLRLPVFRGRLTGLLSRSPPTDTRPQARAYWARFYCFESSGNASGFLGRRGVFADRRKPRVKLGRARVAGTPKSGNILIKANKVVA